MYTPLITQSLIKEAYKKDHCPRQLFYAFVEGKDLISTSENMTLGRYFESEVIGACRGGVKEPAQYYQKNGNGYNKGDKKKAFVEIDEMVSFCNDVFKRLRITAHQGQLEVISDYLKGSIDFVSNDIENPDITAIYDLKLTMTAPEDRWNGWGDIESKTDSHLQAVHYAYVWFKKHGTYPPFYFLVFGLNNGHKWVKVIRIRVSEQSIQHHEERIKYTANLINKYATENWKGNGSLNKCLSCPFYNDCPDKAENPTVETLYL